MKKRFLFVLISLLSAFSLIFAFGCNDSPEDETHNYTVTFFFFEESPDNRTVEVSYQEKITLPTPTVNKTGHTFKSWLLDGSAVADTTANEIVYNFNKDITLIAEWQPKEFTVTLDADGGSIAQETVTAVYGNTLDLPVPQKTGYTFNGWVFGEHVIAVGSVYSYTEDITVSAIWAKDVYEITYDTAIIGAPVSYTVEDEVSLPTLTKDGYTFNGWLDGDNLISVISKGTTGNKSLVASFTANTYTVSSSEQGVDDISVTYDEDFTLPVPQKAGYNFNGWYYGEQQVISGKYNFTTDISLTAKWSLTEYSIQYNANGGTGDLSKTSYTVEDEITLPVLTKDGYNFNGWLDGDTLVSVISAGTTGNKSLIASFTANTYTVSFSEQEFVAVSVTYGEKFTLPIPTKEGFTFVGWYYGETLITENYTYNFTTDITVTAKWSSKDYSIIYNTLGGTFDSEPVSDYDVEDEVILPTLTKDGYTFNGWLDGDNLISVISKGTTGNKSLVASFTANTYTVSFGEQGVDDISVTYGEEFTLPVPQKDGYSFNGWYYQEQLVSEDKYNFTTDITVTAGWTAITYSITYNANGGTGDLSKTSYTVEDEITLPVLTKDGYNFNGWKDLQGETVTKINMGSTGNKSFTASFSANTYTVSSSEQEFDDVSVTYGEKFTLSVPQKAGYDFNGWYYGEILITENYTYNFTTDITVTAKWTAINYSIEYNLNGGTGLPVSRPLSFTVESEDISLPAVTRENYVFTGWQTANGDVITVIPAGTVGNLSLTATWKGKTIRITFNADGGSVTPAYIDAEYNSQIVLPTPQKQGCSFSGWYYEGVQAGTTVIWTQNVTLTARWVEGYTVTFQLDYYNASGKKIGTSTLENPNAPLTVAVGEGETLGDKLPELKERPYEDNYYFAGWFYKTDSGNEVKITEDTVFTNMGVASKNITVYAKLARSWIGPY